MKAEVMQTAARSEIAQKSVMCNGSPEMTQSAIFCDIAPIGNPSCGKVLANQSAPD